MPIHVRAEKGDYAEACLVPGDPLRAKYIAENFLEGAEQKNWERGMLGYTGTFNGRPVSVQSTGMGCPSAAIVFEELHMLGVKRILRIGTCGGLQPDLTLGDLIVAVSAVPQDATAIHYLAGESHSPTADWDLVHGAVHAAKKLSKPVRVGPIVSSDIFYDPDKARAPLDGNRLSGQPRLGERRHGKGLGGDSPPGRCCRPGGRDPLQRGPGRD